MDRLSFNRQLSYFQNTVADLRGMLGVASATKLLNEAMYFIVFGSNDYINNYLLHDSVTSRRYTPQQYEDLLVSTFRQQLMVSDFVNRMLGMTYNNLICVTRSFTSILTKSRILL